MFGDHKLFRTGTEAQAVVVSSKLRTSGSGMLGTWHLELAVPFPDGTTGTAAAKVSEQHLHAPSPGDLVPVRYDPANRSKVVVDEPALEARRAARAQANNAGEAARVQRALDGLRNTGKPE
jgi:hypothetical protein